MAFDTARVTLTNGATAVKVAENTKDQSFSDASSRSYVIVNRTGVAKTGTASVFLGKTNSTTTASPSFEWLPADGPFPIDLEPGEVLYGFVASGAADQTLHIASVGRS